MTIDQARQVDSQPASESRALVGPAALNAVPPLPRHQATFLAHLIATKHQVPQTRARRRAEPAQAVNAYRAMAELAKWG